MTYYDSMRGVSKERAIILLEISFHFIIAKTSTYLCMRNREEIVPAFWVQWKVQDYLKNYLTLSQTIITAKAVSIV